MDYGFKFEIGQLLKPVFSLPRQSRFSFEKLTKYVVVERILQECPGGVQRLYTCRAIGPDGGVATDYMRFNEIELEPATTFEEDEKAREEEDAKQDAARAAPK